MEIIIIIIIIISKQELIKHNKTADVGYVMIKKGMQLISTERV